ncbi:MAG: AAA family ATPase [Armatimonadota bacterium]|jgi:cellulose biosynthesis protein BcsQ
MGRHQKPKRRFDRKRTRRGEPKAFIGALLARTFTTLCRVGQCQASHPRNSVPNLFLLPSDMELAGAEVELVQEKGREQAFRNLLAPIKPEFDILILDAPSPLGILTVFRLPFTNGL